MSPYKEGFIFKMLETDMGVTIDTDNYEVSSPSFKLGQFNTTVSITPRHRSNIYGKHSFDYNRFDLSILGDIEVPVTNEVTIFDLLPVINELDLIHIDSNSPLKHIYDLNLPLLDIGDIINKYLPPFGSSNRSFITMVAAPGSYLFTSQVTLILKKNA